MIIYHSREALTARLAALLHAGRLGVRPDPAVAWEAVEPLGAYGDAGLWPAGPDAAGRPIYAVGRASRHDVVERVFTGVAAIFGIEADRFMLVDVGPTQAWSDLLVIALRRAGLERAARRLEERQLRRRWAECRRAVDQARLRLAERRGLPPADDGA